MEGIKELTLEKGMYQACGTDGKRILFTDLLEQLDPSGEYAEPLNKMTAFERQLARFGIKTNGSATSIVQKFFATNASSVLFPAWVDLQLRAGIMAEDIMPQLSAASIEIDSHTYQGIQMNEAADDRNLYEAGEGAELAETEITVASQSITLRKFGRVLKATYEAVRLQKVNVIAAFLQRMGRQLALNFCDHALYVLIYGDGNSNALTPIEADVSGTLDYDEMVKLYLGFPQGYKLRKIVAGDLMLRALLNLAEYKDPMAGFNFQKTGELISPLGAQLIRWTSTAVLPTDYVLGIDNTIAIMEVREGGELLVESDKLIDKQIERSVVSCWRGYKKLDSNAVKALNITA